MGYRDVGLVGSGYEEFGIDNINATAYVFILDSKYHLKIIWKV